MSAAKEIILYVIPGCRRCEELRTFLMTKGVAFEEVNVFMHPKAVRHISTIGVPAYPALEVRGAVHPAIDCDQLQALMASA